MAIYQPKRIGAALTADEWNAVRRAALSAVNPAVGAGLTGSASGAGLSIAAQPEPRQYIDSHEPRLEHVYCYAPKDNVEGAFTVIMLGKGIRAIQERPGVVRLERFDEV